MKVLNNSGIHPAGYRVLVLPEEIEEVTEGGIILAKETTDKEAMRQIKATVIEVGEAAWGEYSARGHQPWARVGNEVLIAKFAGYLHKGDDGREYRVISDLDVVAVIKGENNE